MRSKFLQGGTNEWYNNWWRSQSLLNEVKVSTQRSRNGSKNVLMVAIPFKWGQSFYSSPGFSWSLEPGVAIPFKWGQSFYMAMGPGEKGRGVSQSLLNEVKVSTLRSKKRIRKITVAIPFKWGQSFYRYPRVYWEGHWQSQSLLNEVKVSTE